MSTKNIFGYLPLFKPNIILLKKKKNRASLLIQAGRLDYVRCLLGTCFLSRWIVQMSTKSFQSLEILPRGNITMIRLSVFCVFFLTLYVCLAQEVCYPPCTCNIKSGWSGLYYIKTIRSSTFQNCNAQHLNEIPNPIHQSIVILQLNKNRITKLEVFII